MGAGDVFQGGQRASDDYLCGVDDPLKSSPVCCWAACEPHWDTVCHHSLDGGVVEDHLQFFFQPGIFLSNRFVLYYFPSYNWYCYVNRSSIPITISHSLREILKQKSVSCLQRVTWGMWEKSMTLLVKEQILDRVTLTDNWVISILAYTVLCYTE